MNNDTFISDYFDFLGERGRRDKEYGNLMVRDDVLYSYGQHFPMAVPIPGNGYLLNGDKYSVTTSHHQGITRRNVGSAPHCIVPFTALYGAIGNRSLCDAVKKDFHIVDVTEDQYRDVEYKDPETGETKTRTEHLLGSTVFKIDGKYYLSGTDPSGIWGRNYFLTRLIREVHTVEEAYETLKPVAVLEAEARGAEVKRQGEWFFIPTDLTYKFPKGTKVLKSIPLPPSDNRVRPHSHIPTETVMFSGFTFCRGTVRHKGDKYAVRDRNNYEVIIKTKFLPGDHKMLKLGKVWHKAVPNVQDGSWGSTGTVD